MATVKDHAGLEKIKEAGAKSLTAILTPEAREIARCLSLPVSLSHPPSLTHSSSRSPRTRQVRESEAKKKSWKCMIRRLHTYMCPYLVISARKKRLRVCARFKVQGIND